MEGEEGWCWGGGGEVEAAWPGQIRQILSGWPMGTDSTSWVVVGGGWTGGERLGAKLGGCEGRRPRFYL